MRVLALLAVLFAAAPAALAETWGPPTADYSADLAFTNEAGQTLRHRFYYTPKRQRLDYKVGERDETAIVDQIEAAVFVLYPEQKRFLKSPLVEPEFDFGIGRAETKREKLGEEEIDGRRTVKYRVEAKTAQGQIYSGLAWLSAERIVVKLDGEIKHGRRARRITMAMAALKVGPVDPAVFRIPDGFTRIEDKPR